MKKTDVLTTARLELRPFEDGDLENALAIFCSDAVKASYMLPDFPDRQSAEKLFARFQTLSRDPDRFVYAVALEGRLIGFVNETEAGQDGIELGYAYDPAFWNRGYASEALGACIEELFRMGYGCVTAAHFEDNPASGRVMRKCGMQPSGKAEYIEYRGKEHKCQYYEIRNDLR